jgi:hypothetical protein
MMGNGGVRCGMELGYKFGLMVRSTKVNGRIIKLMGGVSFGIMMGTSTRASGRMIKRMDLVFILIKMERGTMGIGKMTCKMAMGKKHGNNNNYIRKD